jgi:hypothetical protein
MRSVRDSEPVLIWPALVATAMSAMVVSSVSPERWLMTEVYPVALGHLDGVHGLGQGADLVDLDEDRVGGALVLDPALRNLVLVTNRSSPTSCTLPPMRSVSSFQPSQSSSSSRPRC